MNGGYKSGAHDSRVQLAFFARFSACTAFIAIGVAVTFPSLAQTTVSQYPVMLIGGDVPGNLALVLSVEFPTAIAVANIEKYFNNEHSYTGYFDSNKCYQYRYSDITDPYFGLIKKEEEGGYFTPVKYGSSCVDLWSGNYLNWATTQAIDPFRKALTGGYRVIDIPSQTILEKATRGGRGANTFPDRIVYGSALIQRLSPFNTTSLATSVSRYDRNASARLQGYQRNKMLRVSSGKAVKYYSVRVEVCKGPSLLENNCVQYGGSWKPEGLIQKYSDSMRFSVFSYLNIDDANKDGGVLRSQQKYVGKYARSPSSPISFLNSSAEWSSSDGVFVANPTHDTIGNSGVINYINKFGELTNFHKHRDPVSELYYAALRYFRNLGNVPSYSSTVAEVQKDKFPVVTQWNDPIQYSCQKNIILGIGDVLTHHDHDIPVGKDSLPINSYTQKVFDLEGVSKTASAQFTGSSNSALIAGQAYYANTSDIRPDIVGKQTISTYWVDVLAGNSVYPKSRNQYWLAAKYGGFLVPEDFGDPLKRTGQLDRSWWNLNGQRLSSGDLRPDNLFLAGDAAKMVDGLTQAFAKINTSAQITASALTSNATSLDTDTAVFQSRLSSRSWAGDIMAKHIDAEGRVAEQESWSAARELDERIDINSRKIFTVKPVGGTGANARTLESNGIDYVWDSLSATQKEQLKFPGDSNSVAMQRLLYLRGDRTHEAASPSAPNQFRQRESRVGDIVNSAPQYIHSQNYGYSRLDWKDGVVGAAYRAMRTSASYLARTPLLLVGANDGMLHGFDASIENGGSELFAYVPNSVFNNLKNLSDPQYTHQYFVDGTPRASDVWLSDSWKRMVVGATGAGGKSIFALDITSPDSMESSDVMWEFSHPQMGYTIGQPALVALPNETFGVIVSSGYHDSEPTTNGKLWILSAADGSVIKEITLPTKGNLGSPLVVDTDFNRVADRVYVADTLGNVWRIGLEGKNPSKWEIPTSLNNKPMFIAKDVSGNRQAITAPLSSAFNDRHQHMIYFGTGSFYRKGDNEVPANPGIETFYGIIDSDTAVGGRDDLLKQAIVQQVNTSELKGRVITENELTSERGWYMDLGWFEGAGATGAQGERMTAKASLSAGQVIINTQTPSSDPCGLGGYNWMMAVSLTSGARLNYAFFDSNGDGSADDGDTVKYDGEDVVLSGVGDPHDVPSSSDVTTVYDMSCSLGANGSPVCIPLPNDLQEGRQSWREVRSER